MSSPDEATWRSGYATVCKTVYTSSILVVASINIIRLLRRVFQKKIWLCRAPPALGRVGYPGRAFAGRSVGGPEGACKNHALGGGIVVGFFAGTADRLRVSHLC